MSNSDEKSTGSTDRVEAGKRLRQARKAAGFSSGEKACERFGWNPNTYQSHEKGRNGFNATQATEYGAAYKVPAAWLLLGEGADGEILERAATEAALSGSLPPGDAEFHSAPGLWARDVPILGSAAGALAISLKPKGKSAGMTVRPPGLIGNARAYALWVEGDSMAPEFRAGDIAYIDPHRPIRPGDIVVIRQRASGSGAHVFIKTLISQTDDEIVTEQHNGGTRTAFKRAAVLSIERVLRPNEFLSI